MSGKLPIEIGYNKALGGITVVSAIFILFVAVLTGRLFPQAITGGILLFVSFGYLTKPALVLTANEVRQPALFGPVVKRYVFKSISEVSVQNGRVHVAGEKVGVHGWMTSGADVAELERYLAAAHVGANVETFT